MERPRRQYEKPPLVEVSCQFVFEPADNEGWDEFSIPSFYEQLKEKYPHRRQQPTASVQSPEDLSGEFNAEEFGSFPVRFHFDSKDGKTAVRLGENVLVVDQLPPYYGWERFEPRALEAFGLYVSTWKPVAVSQAVLHYIDRIDIPENDFRLQDYFNLYPALPDGIERPLTNLAMSFQVPAEREGDVFSVSFRQYPSASPGSVSFLLFWGYVAPGPLETNLGSIGEWLRAAHDFSGQYFRAALTDKCEQLFEPKDRIDD